MELLEYESISNFITTDCYPSGYTKIQKRVFRRRASNYRMYNGKLVKPSGNENLIVIKQTELYDILKEIHDNSGHQCDRYTCNIGKDRYYWPCMLKDITLYVQNCARCAKNQPCLKKPTTPLQPLPVITKIWFRVGMDLTGPLIDSNGFKYILSVIDHFTRWLETRPLRCKEAQEVAGGIYSIYCRQGAPVQVISDNGTEFTNQLYKTLHQVYNCKLIFSTPYHPQTNGLVESSHKALKRSLVKALDEKKENWYNYLEEITFSLNIRPRHTTHFSAFELMHGSRKPRLPIQAENLALLYPDVVSSTLDEWAAEDDIIEQVDSIHKFQLQNQEIAGDHLTHSKSLMKAQHDKKINPVTFKKIEKGDEVLIENNKVNPTNVRIVKNKRTQRVKRSNVKLWKKAVTDANKCIIDSNSERELSPKSDEEAQLHSRYSLSYLCQVNANPGQHIRSILNQTVSYSQTSQDASTTEDMCVTWNGHFNGVKLVNTCSVDNFLTLLSLHQDNILKAFHLAGEAPSDSLNYIFTMIDEQNFDELRMWVASQLRIPLINNEYNMFASEGSIVKLFQNLAICQDAYRIVFQCWSCCCQSEKKLNLISLMTFKHNCQTSIDHHISLSYKCLKCRDLHANLEFLSREFLKVTPLLIFEVGHINA